MPVSIPHSGHPSFRPKLVGEWRNQMAQVSIPHSGHPSFRLRRISWKQSARSSFHPAFGPPLIQTLKGSDTDDIRAAFPSRIRATHHSDSILRLHTTSTIKVSIPHSGHPSFRRSNIGTSGGSDIGFHPAFGPPLIQTRTFAHLRARQMSVSIPHSGHPSFRHVNTVLGVTPCQAFPSRIRATPHSDATGTTPGGTRDAPFPSRIRATPHSDPHGNNSSTLASRVSIPHSGHPSFRLAQRLMRQP